jgi:hypothetical protein
MTVPILLSLFEKFNLSLNFVQKLRSNPGFWRQTVASGTGKNKIQSFETGLGMNVLPQLMCMVKPIHFRFLL